MAANSWNLPRITSLALLLVVFWLSMPEPCEARPSWTLPATDFYKKFGPQTQCDQDGDLQELCQRCAKATKSNVAYPMCCNDEENAVSWCKDYVYFGIQ